MTSIRLAVDPSVRRAEQGRRGFRIFELIARDPARRAASGWPIVSTAEVSTRHSQAFLAREGSG